jgi:hypothetical protein
MKSRESDTLGMVLELYYTKLGLVSGFGNAWRWKEAIGWEL